MFRYFWMSLHAILLVVSMCLSTACDSSSDSSLPPVGDGDTDTDTDSDGDSDGDGDPPGNVSVDTSFNVAGNVRSDCSDGQPFVPFGVSPAHYVSGSVMPELSFSRMSEVVASFYAEWKTLYLGNSAACGLDRYYVTADLDGRISVSEGHGYGMLIMAYIAGHEPEAKTYFDGMVRYYQDHPSHINSALMAWAQDASCNNVDGAANATDGDMDIAFALMLAHKQWGSKGEFNYLALAERLVDAIMASNVSADGKWLKLGDWVSTGTKYSATRPSDFMPGHMASFELLKGNNAWRNLRNSLYGILATVQNQHASSSGLMPDFVRNADGVPHPVEPSFHESVHDGDYYYNACRVPLRLATDYLSTGNLTSRDLLARVNYFIRNGTGETPSRIAVGYKLDGQPIETGYTSWAFIAPMGPGAMVKASNQEWVNAVWNHLVSNKWKEAYYEDTIKLLSLIVMSGNWWSPQDIDC